MYEAHFYTAHDFESSSSEESLTLYWGKTVRDDSLAIDPGFFAVLSELKLPVSFQSAQPFSLHPQLASTLKDWNNEAKRILSLVTPPNNYDFSFVERTWVSHDIWNDSILIGEGQGRWVVVHWFTTA